MVNAYYLNKLAERSKNSTWHRWKLGEICNELILEGKRVTIDKSTGTYQVLDNRMDVKK